MNINTKLQCEIVGLQYDFKAKTGLLYMGENSCCDMGGCLDLFKAIDKGVRIILTYSGSAQDTSYYKLNDKEWSAYLPR
jgi:hypothetical protein